MTSIVVDGRFQLDYDPLDHEFVVSRLRELQDTLDGRRRDYKILEDAKNG